MISNYVNTSIDLAQKRLYDFKSKMMDPVATSQEDGELDTKKAEEVSLATRVKVVPFAFADLILESVRSVGLMVESAALTALSILAVPAAFAYGVTEGNYTLTKQMMRVTLINLNNTIYNVVHGSLKIALAPLFLLGKMALLAMDPKDQQSSKATFEDVAAKRVGKNFDDTQLEVFDLINKQSKTEDIKNKAEKESKKDESAQAAHSLKTRAKALGLAFADSGLEIVKPFVVTVIAVAQALKSLFKDFPIEVWTAYKRPQEANVKGTFVSFFKTLNAVIENTAQLVTKTAMAPFTLIAQIANGIVDPLSVLPSKDTLYVSKIGDYRVTRDGFEQRKNKLYDGIDENKDWESLFEKTNEVNDESLKSQYTDDSNSVNDSNADLDDFDN